MGMVSKPLWQLSTGRLVAVDIISMRKFVGQLMNPGIAFVSITFAPMTPQLPASFIKEMEENSSVTYHEAQIAQARLWIGEDSFGHQEKVRIQGPRRKPLAPEEIVKKFEIGVTREDLGVVDSTAQHALGDKTDLKDEKWYGTEQEEGGSYVSEVLCVHSKVMIADDRRRTTMSSANINDRSQKGNVDSEILTKSNQQWTVNQ
ncbi:unnamed protein product [Rhizoctonia solani]|nr:unnamed protein product [Rhizoctonia solani]